MAKKITLSVVALVLLLLAYATTRPDSFRVERSTTIQAPPDKIYPLLNDFHQFGIWSPWEKLDPALQRTFSGAESGPGAVYAWTGNSDVGAGRMEILQTIPNKRVTVQLDFLEPIAGRNLTEYALEAHGDSTTVTWTMLGPSPYLTKLMGVFVSMDTMIGKDFEKGLSQLKAVAEK
jgi:uncharacterized protein YndB with AHSA1/START domain